ncbi:MAG: A24 family peptidase [Pseudomonadota bacterium]
MQLFSGSDAVIWAATLILTLALLAIARIDARSLRIPDVISLPLICAGLLLAAAQPGWQDHLIGAVVGFAVLGGLGEAYFRRTGREGLGLGDAKLFAAAGAWLGWQALPQVLLIAALGGLAFAALRRQTAGGIAFGPWLALGFWLVWMGQRVISYPG